MNKNTAVPGKHQLNDPPRFNEKMKSSHCGDNHIAASGKSTIDFEKNKIVNIQKGSHMSQAVAVRKEEQSQEFAIIEQVVMKGDLSVLDPRQRLLYYRKVCESAGLNPLTRPFEYLELKGKLTLYARKDATDQLRKMHGISIEKLESKVIDDLYIVTAAKMYKIPIEKVTKEIRQKSKISCLLCQYGGTKKAMIKNNDTIEDPKKRIPVKEMASIVSAWRKTNPNIVQFWWDMGKAAVAAVKTGNKQDVCKGISFYMIGKNLQMKMPSGKSISYVGAHLKKHWVGAVKQKAEDEVGHTLS